MRFSTQVLNILYAATADLKEVMGDIEDKQAGEAEAIGRLVKEVHRCIDNNDSIALDELRRALSDVEQIEWIQK